MRVQALVQTPVQGAVQLHEQERQEHVQVTVQNSGCVALAPFEFDVVTWISRLKSL